MFQKQEVVLSKRSLSQYQLVDGLEKIYMKYSKDRTLTTEKASVPAFH